MKSGKIISSLLAAGCGLFGQQLVPGEVFPRIAGQTINDRPAQLPEACRGKPSVLVMGFTKDAGRPSIVWANRFLQDHSLERVGVFQIPILENAAPRMIRPLIARGLRREVPATLYDYVLLVYQNESVWKRRLGFSRPEWSYLVVLDSEARVVVRHAGHYNEADYLKLKGELDRLARAGRAVIEDEEPRVLGRASVGDSLRLGSR